MTPTATGRSLLDRAAEAGLFRDRVAGRGLTVTAVVRVVAGLLFFPLLSSSSPPTRPRSTCSASSGCSAPAPSYTWSQLSRSAGAPLLLLGLTTRLAAAALASNMIGAVLTAGTHVGGPIHLGLAPALLLAMLYLLWAGPGAAAVDRRWSTNSGSSPY